jgi:hypothetical protein
MNDEQLIWEIYLNSSNNKLWDDQTLHLKGLV